MDSRSLIIMTIVSILLTIDFVNATNDSIPSWEEFKIKFGKDYGPIEEQLRKEIYLKNTRYIEIENAKSNQTFRLGINNLTDSTFEEVKNELCGLIYDDETVSDNMSREEALELLLDLNLTLSKNANRKLSPMGVDWREFDLVTDIKDQGHCGSCWAFAAIGALEGILAGRGEKVVLSEQNLIDCTLGGKYDNCGCGGGKVENAFEYVKDYGIMSNNDYLNEFMHRECKFNKNKSLINVSGNKILPKRDEEFLRMMLSTFGPIPVAIDVTRKFKEHRSGVFYDPDCSEFNLSHAVLLVGYGTDKYEGDFWIVKNSWGADWGENGYIKMARNRGNNCGIATYAVIPLL